jgi:tubulin--tyrosine ligase
MADRGMGIRLFNSKDALQHIFDEFEGDSEDEMDDEESNATSVVTSQLRHFIVQVRRIAFTESPMLTTSQEYISNPLLIDPSEAFLANPGNCDAMKGHKVCPASLEDLTVV